MRKKLFGKVNLIFVLFLVAFFAFEGTITHAATIGHQLTEPETGWKRYDPDIVADYVGRWMTAVDKNDRVFTGGSVKYTETNGDYLTFKFVGTKFRLIAETNSEYSKEVEMNIDGNVEYFSQYNDNKYISQVLVYEKLGLANTVHEIIIKKNDSLYMHVDAIDIDDTAYIVNTNLAAPASLIASLNDSSINLNWSNVDGATFYNIKRSTSSGGPYETIETSVTEATYTDSNVLIGTKYYYLVTAENSSGESEPSNEASAVITIPDGLLRVSIPEDVVKVGDKFTSTISLENLSGIYAEDFTIQYDANLFEFLGFEEIIGYKVYNKPIDENGRIRFIVASQGEEYGIDQATIFLNLNFRAKAIGVGNVDALKCRVANTETEWDLESELCGIDTITVVKADILDVNHSGEYSLVDLAIDGLYFGLAAIDTDTVNHSADQVIDGNVNDDDLFYIVSQMLANSNYSPNN